jgi:hypothetical protein
MGQQYNKIEKRRRRANYIQRQKDKAKGAGAAGSKPKARRPAKKKAAETAA